MKIAITITSFMIALSKFAYAGSNPKVDYVYVVHNPFVEQQAWRDYQQARHQKSLERNEATRNKQTTVVTVGSIKIGQNSPSAADLFSEKMNRNKVAAK
jgi:hypothetical protein